MRYLGQLVLLVLATVAWGFPGDFDPTFGSGGSVTLALSPGEDEGFAVAVQPDGRILVAGTSFGQGFLLRLEAAGNPDPTFGTGGLAYSSISGAFIALALEPDGKIVAFGSDAALERYDGDGTRDGGFASAFLPIDAQSRDDAADVLRLADGTFVVTGSASLDGTLSLVRVRTDGSVDPTFGASGIASAPPIGTGGDLATSVAEQADGKLVVAGQTNASGDHALALARFGTNGALDATFGTGGTVQVYPTPGSSFRVHTVAVTGTGRIVVFGTDGRGPASYVLLRFLPDGTLDPSFGTGGKVVAAPSASSFGGDMVLQPEGGIVIFGASAGLDNLLRFHADGTPDPSFGIAGVANVGIGGCCDNAHGLARTADGKLIGVGKRYGSAATFFDLTVLRALGAQCGNGIIEDEEQCDDNNTANGDCCSSSCQLDGAGIGCTDDGLACTDDLCDGAGTCVHTPRVRTLCRHTTLAGKAQLVVRRKAGGKNALSWKLTKGEAVGLGELGNPLSNTDYALCGFDASGSATGALLFDLPAPGGGTCAGKPCWSVSGAGFKYKNRDHTPGGTEQLKAIAGPTGTSKFGVTGKGPSLTLPPFPLPLPVRVQLQIEGGPCLEATYTTPIHSDAAQFKAKGQ